MDDKLIFQLSQAEYLVKNYVAKKMKHQGIILSSGQVGILFLLEKNEGMNMSELSRILGSDNSAITRLIDRLETLGLVIRTAHRDDRRQNIISITEKGKAEAEKAGIIARETNEKIKEGFNDEELAAFKKILFSFHDKFKIGLS